MITKSNAQEGIFRFWFSFGVCCHLISGTAITAEVDVTIYGEVIVKMINEIQRCNLKF